MPSRMSMRPAWRDQVRGRRRLAAVTMTTTKAAGFAGQLYSAAVGATFVVDWGDVSAPQTFVTELAHGLVHVHLTHNYADTTAKSIRITGDVALVTRLLFPTMSLTALDVSACSALGILWCYENALVTLDVRACGLVTQLWCNDNSLVSLGASGLALMSDVDFDHNNLTSLDVSGAAIWAMVCSYNPFSSAAVDAVLVAVNAQGLSAGYIDITHTAVPTSVGLAAKAAMEVRGWYIEVDV